MEQKRQLYDLMQRADYVAEIERRIVRTVLNMARLKTTLSYIDNDGIMVKVGAPNVENHVRGYENSLQDDAEHLLITLSMTDHEWSQRANC